MPSLAVCRDCGESVRWARRENGRMASLKQNGMALAVDHHNTIRSVAIYEWHTCDPEQVEAWRQQKTDEEVSREAHFAKQEAFWEASLKRECPRCDAAIGVRCKNLIDRAHGKPERDVKWPHIERVPEPLRVEWES